MRGLTQVPEALAKLADARAWEIFQREANMGQPFHACLGQVYMVAIKAAFENIPSVKRD